MAVLAIHYPHHNATGGWAMTQTVEQRTAPSEAKVGFPKITTVVRADRAMLAGLFTSDEECRYYLQGILIHKIEDGSVNIAATNGHIMGVFNDDSGFCREPENFIVKLPKEAAALIKKDTARGIEGWLVIHSGGTQRIAHVVRSSYDMDEISAHVSSLNTIWTGKVEVIDGVYPQYRSAIPKELDAVGTPVIQSKYLNIFHLVAKAQLNTGVSLAAIQLYAKGKNDPVLVNVHGRTDFVGVVMPVSLYDEFRIPSFAKNAVSKSLKGKGKAKRPAKEMESA